MTAASDATGLAAFVPLERRVTLASGVVTVRPLTLRQLPAFARAVQTILPFLLAGQVIAALTEDAAALIAAVAAATGIAPEAMPEDPAEFVDLAGAVVEVNVDFFARRLLPADRAAGAAIRAATGTGAGGTGAATAPAGDLSLPGSASADTGSTISSG